MFKIRPEDYDADRAVMIFNLGVFGRDNEIERVIQENFAMIADRVKRFPLLFIALIFIDFHWIPLESFH